MPAPAIFGITDDTVNTVVNLLMLFLVVLWLALVFYTYTDAKRRIADPMLVGCATAASLFPFVGTIVYLILRPPEFLDDVRERELEIAASEARLLQLHETTCPHCAYPVEKAFLRCPNCRKRLKEPCATCRKPLDPRWSICPYCEAEVGQVPPRRRRTAAEGARPRPERAAPAERQPTGDRLASGGSSPSRAPSRPAEGRPRPTAADGDYPARSPAPADTPPALDQPTARPRTPG